MKYKLLLVGKNKGLINDFFMQMDTFFDSLTSSMRFADLLGHVKYFKPHAVIFCMNSESRDDMIVINNLHEHLEKSKIPLIIICDSDDYEFFAKLPGSNEDLVLLKPITLIQIQQKLLDFLQKKVHHEELAHGAHEHRSAEAENTLQLLAELEQALSLSEEGAESKSTERDNENSASGRPKRVMIVDDASGMLKAIKEHLGSEYEVATAISGKIALRYLQNKTVDLILLDYEMPEMDGHAVFEKLLANPQTANIPVVFLTGINDSAKIQKALSLKPKGYLLKPVDKDTLLAKVHEILG